MYVLFITHQSGYVQTITFSSEPAMAAAMTALSVQPVTLRTWHA